MELPVSWRETKSGCPLDGWSKSGPDSESGHSKTFGGGPRGGYRLRLGVRLSAAAFTALATADPSVQITSTSERYRGLSNAKLAQS